MATLFTLEAMHAKHGDALLLHYGSTDDPKLVMIDGGPPGVKPRLVKRLEELRTERATDEGDPLQVELLMVSHVDEDHVTGVQGILQDMADAKADKTAPLLAIGTLWHNSFGDLVTADGDAGGASASDVGGAGVAGAATAGAAIESEAASAVSAAGIDGGTASIDEKALDEHKSLLVLASVRQGRDVRRLARALGLSVNAPFKGLVRRGKKVTVHELDGGLRLHVLAPDQARLDELRKSWVKELKKLTPAERAVKVLDLSDDSVYNLSSIVVVAEVKVGTKTRRMLLTGDARGDHILEGLQAAGMLDAKGRARFDLLKVPHHGSDRNVDTDFFRRVLADTYVVSADGKFGNPDVPMLEMLVDARKGETFTIVLTNGVPHATAFLKQRLKDGEKFRVMIRDEAHPSVRVHLGKPLEA